MALQLLIFRHAKSGWDADTDHQRTLTTYGEQQAKFIGEWLAEQGQTPDLILCSSAARAIATMELAITAGHWNSDSSISDAFYETNAETVLELIRHLSDTDKTVMLVGHEPTWSELASSLTGESVTFNTAGICCINFDKDSWSQINYGDGKLLWCQSPD